VTRLVFGQTDSPRLAKVKRKWARLDARRNPKRKPPVYREVCWDGGGRCTPRSCEIADGCTCPMSVRETGHHSVACAVRGAAKLKTDAREVACG
jgi:hypothetical protein